MFIEVFLTSPATKRKMLILYYYKDKKLEHKGE